MLYEFQFLALPILIFLSYYDIYTFLVILHVCFTKACLTTLWRYKIINSVYLHAIQIFVSLANELNNTAMDYFFRSVFLDP